MYSTHLKHKAARFAGKHSVTDAMERFGLSRSTINNTMKALGIPHSQNGWLGLSPEYRETIAREAAQTSTYQAAAKYGVSTCTIRADMKKFGIKARRVGNLDTYQPELRMKAIRLVLAGKKPVAVEKITHIPARYISELTLKYKRQQAA